jgi:hypothetical protein
MYSTPDGVFYWAYSIGHIRLHPTQDNTTNWFIPASSAVV